LSSGSSSSLSSFTRTGGKPSGPRHCRRHAGYAGPEFAADKDEAHFHVLTQRAARILQGGGDSCHRGVFAVDGLAADRIVTGVLALASLDRHCLHVSSVKPAAWGLGVAFVLQGLICFLITKAPAKKIRVTNALIPHSLGPRPDRDAAGNFSGHGHSIGEIVEADSPTPQKECYDFSNVEGAD
jgi:hypothetical protein